MNFQQGGLILDQPLVGHPFGDGVRSYAKCPRRVNVFRVASDCRPSTASRPRPTKSYPAAAADTPCKMRHLLLGQTTLDP